MHRALTVAVVVGLLLGGCYRTHTRGEDTGPSADTAALDVRAIDAPTTDTPHVDAAADEGIRCECCPGVSILSAPGFGCEVACSGLCRCADRRPTALCFRAPVAGAPIDVEVQVAEDDCYCGQALTCSVETVEDRVGLTSQICPGIACERCGEPPPNALCTIPAQLEGRHHASPDVHRGGGDLLDLEVLSPGDPEADADVCIRPALPSCGARWEPEPLVSDRACHASTVAAGSQVTIEVEDACGERMQPGHCTVSVRGAVITVRPTRTPSRCPGFGRTPTCSHPVHTCITPRLAEGRYSVVVEGLLVTDGSPPSTIDVAPDGVAVQSCRGART